MKDKSWRQVGAVCGFAFVLLTTLAYILGANDPPAFNDGAGATAAFVADNGNEIDTAAALLAGALIFFAFFLGTLSSNNRKADRMAILSITGHAGGIAALVLAITGLVLEASSSAASANGADDTVVTALFQTGMLAFSGAALGSAVLIYATGRVVMRHGNLNALLGVPGVVLGVATAAVTIISLTTRDGAFSPYDGELPLIMLGLFGLWALVASWSLYDKA